MEGVDGSLLVVGVDIPAGQHMLQAHQVTIPAQRSKLLRLIEGKLRFNTRFPLLEGG
jgi:hypothetical protein